MLEANSAGHPESKYPLHPAMESRADPVRSSQPLRCHYHGGIALNEMTTWEASRVRLASGGMFHLGQHWRESY